MSDIKPKVQQQIAVWMFREDMVRSTKIADSNVYNIARYNE